MTRKIITLTEALIRTCPFCGGTPYIRTRGEDGARTYSIACSKCQINTRFDIDPEEAIKKWNRRTEE